MRVDRTLGFISTEVQFRRHGQNWSLDNHVALSVGRTSHPINLALTGI